MSRSNRPRATSPVGRAPARSNLTELKRRSVYNRLLAVPVDGWLTATHSLLRGRGALPLQPAHREARLGPGQGFIAAGSLAAVVASKIRGRKAARTLSDIEDKIKAVPHHLRQPLRSDRQPEERAYPAHEASTRLKARSSHVRPMLTDTNKRARLAFASSFVRPLSDGTNTFVNMHDYVHVDEKWFYLTKVKRRYYVYDDEESVDGDVYCEKMLNEVVPAIQAKFPLVTLANGVKTNT
ncbi:hypothetical protein ACHHYP_20806 [Achlya hypogyna]|uniref:Uncharacterized protein n=1 Tax=Achlya hypogyna TaxID=1202772 RepID=A0A1V9Y9A8_ACHHY|nr:hypothetical protein ACHHYP_20806 [Achlya hypogyna]